jgi:hypothetical protein
MTKRFQIEGDRVKLVSQLRKLRPGDRVQYEGWRGDRDRGDGPSVLSTRTGAKFKRPAGDYPTRTDSSSNGSSRPMTVTRSSPARGRGRNSQRFDDRRGNHGVMTGLPPFCKAQIHKRKPNRARSYYRHPVTGLIVPICGHCRKVDGWWLKEPFAAVSKTGKFGTVPHPGLHCLMTAAGTPMEHIMEELLIQEVMES